MTARAAGYIRRRLSPQTSASSLPNVGTAVLIGERTGEGRGPSLTARQGAPLGPRTTPLKFFPGPIWLDPNPPLTHSPAGGTPQSITEGQSGMKSTSDFFCDRTLTPGKAALHFAIYHNDFISHWISTNGLKC